MNILQNKFKPYLLFPILLFIIVSGQGQITTFPYSESFETGLGDWSNPGGDDFNWTRDQNGTPSNNTGADHAQNGNWYVFTEASNPNFPNKVAYLQATFDFTNNTDPQFSFYYHMFGADMGTLYLDVFDGIWNNDVWSISGQQHNAEDEDYTQAIVNLTSYAGLSNIIIRFRGETGANFTSDMTIDLIECWDGCSYLNQGIASISTSTLCGSGIVDLNLTGSSGGSSIIWQESFDNITFTDITGATTSTFSTRQLNPDSTFYYRAQVTNICTKYSDTVSVIASTPSAISLPYQEGFETDFGTWSNSSDDNMNWTRQSGATPSNNTGPNTAEEGSWYLFTEASNPNNPDKLALLEQVFDFSGTTNPELSFKYHMFGADMGSLSLDANTDQNIWSISGQQQVASAESWETATVSLSDYADLSCVSLKFKGTTGAGFASDICIDDIQICDRFNPGIISSTQNTICGTGATTLNLNNYAEGSSFQWQMSYDNTSFLDISGATEDSLITRTLNPDSTFFYRVSVTNGCSYFSDTFTVTVLSSGSLGPPYFEGFETNFGVWNNPTSDDMNWTRQNGTTPSNNTGPSQSSEGSFYLFTEASNPNNPSKVALLDHIFDLSGSTHAQFSFDYHMFGADMGQLKVMINSDTLLTISGQQQAAEDELWQEATIDLEDYSGSSCVLVRIIGITGAGFTSDIAIDNFQLCEVIEAGNINISETILCSPGSVDLTLQDYDIGGSIQWQLSYDNISFSDITGATNASISSRTLNPDSIFYFRAAVTNGCTYYSDTVSVMVSSGGGNNVPYFESFEAGFGDWINDTDDDFNWTRQSGATPSNGTGPSTASDGSWYLFTEASNPNFPERTTTLSQTFDFSGTTNPTLSFSYHMFGAEMGSLYIDVNADLAVWSISGQQHAAEGDPWNDVTVDLADYADISCVTISIRGTTGSNYTSDIAIDNIAICDIPQTSNIFGSDSTCTNATGVNYYLTSPSSSTYEWIVNGGSFNPAPSPNDTSISIDWGSSAQIGSISVIEDNGCVGDTVNFEVNIHSFTPDTIYGSTSILENATSILYHLNERPGYTYTWTVSGGSNDPNPTTGQGNDSITVNWGSAGSRSIQVTGNSGCGASSSFVLPVNVYAPIQSITSGSWSNAATWSCTCIPMGGDNVQIVEGDSVYLTQASAASNLVINESAILNNDAFTLSLDGNYINNGSHIGDGTASAQIHLTGNNTSIEGTGLIEQIGQIRILTNDKTIASGTNLTILDATLRLYNGITILNQGSIYAAGTISSVSGTVTWINDENSSIILGGNFLSSNANLIAHAATNRIVYDGTTQVVKTPSTEGYYDLVIAGSGAKTLQGNTVVKNNVTIESTLESANFDLTIGNNLINNGTYTPGSNITTFDGNSSISGSSTTSLNNLIINASKTLTAPSNILSISGNVNNNGQFMHNSGTLLFNGSSTQLLNWDKDTFNNVSITNSTTVEINEGSMNVWGTVDVQNGTLITSDSLTLLSSETVTGRIATLTTGDVQGQVTCERYVISNTGPYGGWHFFSSPVSGKTLEDFNDDVFTSGFLGSDYPNPAYFISAYRYDETLPGLEDIGFVPPLSMAMSLDTATGYWIYHFAPPTETIFDLTGPIFKGDINFPLSYTDDFIFPASEHGWNMAGNPYPSAIDWESADWTRSNISSTIYIWNPNLQTYATYTLGGASTNGGTREIASMQGFWVKATGNNPSLSATEQVKTTGGSFLRSNDTIINYNLKVQTSSYSDECALYQSNDGVIHFHNYLDAIKKPSTNVNVPALSIAMDSFDLAVKSLPLYMDSLTLSVRVKTNFDDSMILSSSTLSGLFETNCLYIVDERLDSSFTIEDLETGYRFFHTNTDTLPRFTIHIGSSSIVEPIKSSCENEQDGSLFIQSKGWQASAFSLEDQFGNTIFDQNIFGKDTLLNLDSGRYSYTMVPFHESCLASSGEVFVPYIQMNLSSNTISKDPSCFGSNNGQISLSEEVIDSNYTFTWNTGNTTLEMDSLPSGEYIVTIHHQEGCFRSDTINLIEPDSLSATLHLQNISCFGSNDGLAEVTIEGGTLPYSYEWSNNEVTNSVQSLSAGIYSVTITDAHQCQKRIEGIELFKDSIQVISTVINPGCSQEDSTGSINLQLFNAVAPVNIQWSNGGTGSSISALFAGTYVAQIIDSAGCVAHSDSLTIEANPSVHSNFTILDTNISVNQDPLSITNTSINAYQYYWNFGDGVTSSEFMPTHTYQLAGVFNVTLVAENDMCSDTMSKEVYVADISVQIENTPNASVVYMYNTINKTLTIKIPRSNAYEFHLNDIQGKSISLPSQNVSILSSNQNNTAQIRLDHLTPGVYILASHIDQEVYFHKLIVPK